MSETVQQQIRESELLVYAIGIDAPGIPELGRFRASFCSCRGRDRRARPRAGRPPASRLNVGALRAITDDSGGRTEIISNAGDLDAATAGIASELSRQYFLGYSTSSPRDGRWHTIDVRVKRGNYTIRARKGFIAEGAQ